MPGLSRHTFRVDPIDGDAYDVSTILADQLAYEQTRVRRKWPQITEGGVSTWWSFLAWHAADREQLFTGTYEQFCAAVVDVDDLTADAGDGDGTGEPVDPTRPAAPDS